MTTEEDFEDGILRTNLDFARWSEEKRLAKLVRRRIDFDANKEFVDNILRKDKELDDWWFRRSKLSQRIYPFKTQKISVMRPPKEARAMVAFHESVRANLTPRNVKMTVEYNIILARLVDKLRRIVQDDGGERE